MTKQKCEWYHLTNVSAPLEVDSRGYSVPKPGNSWLTIVVQVWTIPVLILVSSGIGLLAGYYLDRACKSDPWFSIILTLLGLAAGLYESARILIHASRGNGS
ncbi:MAG: AtpZ/AtpI family protein [Armatimonadota bacterium]|nr:AtpZ/AtpI family protein [Armatimonadota bacterium]